MDELMKDMIEKGLASIGKARLENTVSNVLNFLHILNYTKPQHTDTKAWSLRAWQMSIDGGARINWQDKRK